MKNYGEDLVVYKKNVYNYVNWFKSNFEVQVWQILSYSSNLDEVKENVYKFLKKRKIKKAILEELKNNPIFVNQILANSEIKDCIKKYGKFKI